ncbi:MAG: hypothetical protein ACRDRO_09610 [Pseudonocardiaceae bacterium]
MESSRQRLASERGSLEQLTIGDKMKLNLRNRREKLGYTLSEIGYKLGLSGGTIRNIEVGQHSYYKKHYEGLLTKLELERLWELVQIYPMKTADYIGDLLSSRSDVGDPPSPGLGTV